MRTSTQSTVDPCNQPLFKESCSLFSCKADSSNRQQKYVNFSSESEMKSVDARHRPLYYSVSLMICSSELEEDGKLGFGFMPADEIEELDIGPGDRPRPTYVSKKLEHEAKSQFTVLLKEFADCFVWEYHEMSGLDRSIVEHRLLIKPGF